MIGWGIFSIVLGTIGLFAPIAFSVGVTIFVGAMLLSSAVQPVSRTFWKAQGWGPERLPLFLHY